MYTVPPLSHPYEYLQAIVLCPEDSYHHSATKNSNWVKIWLKCALIRCTVVARSLTPIVRHVLCTCNNSLLKSAVDNNSRFTLMQ